MDKIKVGEFIREKRISLHLTQEELAEKINVTNKTISRWECGIFLPPIEKIYELSELFDVSVDELLQGENAQADEQKKETLKRAQADALHHYRAEQTIKLIFGVSIALIFITTIALSFIFASETFMLLVFAGLFLIQLSFRWIKKEQIRLIASAAIYSIVLCCGIIVQSYFASHISKPSIKPWFTFGSIVLILNLVLLLTLIFIKMRKKLNLPQLKRVPSPVLYVLTAITVVITLFSATVINLVSISRYQPGSFISNTIELFIYDVNSNARGWVTNREDAMLEKFRTTTEQAIELSRHINDLTFEEGKNIFPYQYKGNTAYVNVVICTENFIFRMDDSLTKIALERRDYIGESFYFTSVHYYTCEKETGLDLKNYLLTLNEETNV